MKYIILITILDVFPGTGSVLFNWSLNFYILEWVTIIESLALKKTVDCQKLNF